MKSLRIGAIAGIAIFLHPTFPLFILLVGAAAAGEHGALAGLRSMLVMLLLFVFVLLHELAHSFTARRLGVRVMAITLLPIGGVAATAGMPRRPSHEIFIALAGPAVNVVLALVILGSLALFFPVTLAPAPALDTATWIEIPMQLLAVNVMLALFNLIPAFPLDGGRVLRALLALRLPYATATRRAARVGQIFAAGLIVIGLLNFSAIMLSLIGAFLFLSGRQEAKAVQREEELRRRPAADFLDPRPWFAGSRDTRFSEVCDALMREPALAHCVIDMEGLRYGILTRRDLQSACLALPGALEVHRLVGTALPGLQAATPLPQALAALRSAPQGLLPVCDGMELIGVLSLEGLRERLRLDAS